MALLCTRIPLLDYLGYEFSALTALLASFIAAFITVRAVNDALRAPGDTPPVRAASRAAGRSALATRLPSGIARSGRGSRSFSSFPL